jgi:oxygen-independent coproporphyrinogen-3 oxidase
VKEFSERLAKDKAASEAAILAMRTSWGLDLERFESRFGPEYKSQLVSRLEQIPARYLLLREKSAALTREGLRVGNSLWQLLLPGS